MESTAFGLPIVGADSEPGPIFNYARIYTHSTAAELLFCAFGELNNKVRLKQTVDGRPWDFIDDDRNFQGNGSQLSQYISSQLRDFDLDELPIHSGNRRVPIVRHCTIAAIVAFVLLLGSTGSAILIAFE